METPHAWFSPCRTMSGRYTDRSCLILASASLCLCINTQTDRQTDRGMTLSGEWEEVTKSWLLEREKKGGLSVLGSSTFAVLY